MEAALFFTVVILLVCASGWAYGLGYWEGYKEGKKDVVEK